MDNQNTEKHSGKTVDMPASKKGEVSFIDKIKERVHVIVPSAVVLICAIIVIFLVRNEMNVTDVSSRKFVCNSQGFESYIVFSENGRYRHHNEVSSDESEGTWKEADGKITVIESGSGDKTEIYLIDNKYLAFDDSDFLKGDVPQGSYFDASFTASDGTIHSFTSDGKYFTETDGRNTELGGYITDGNFIIITIDNVTHTYLNCGDGISPVYYTYS